MRGVEMFYSDNPIKTREKDGLNRAVFSMQLAKAILSYTKLDNFTVSLCGKWGSGKTSILNMVVEKIEELSKDLPAEEKPIVVMFNPWNYSDCTQLLSQFFETIKSHIDVDDTSSLSAVGNALQKYSSLLEYTSYIPKIGQFLGPLKSLLESAGAQLQEHAEENSGVAQQKEKVIEALKEQKQKIIVIIDDIDRLNNEQIRLIFQLVNSLAGFPNMIYLLSFDREVVVRALEEEQQCNGEEYLEKIIQVLFEVPTANKALLNQAFTKMYADIIFEDGNPDLSFEREYWDVVFWNCVSPFVNTMRDAKRIINAFEFKHGLIRDETNCIDLLAITTLQVCAPEIYNWINSHSEYLTGSIQSAGGITGEQRKKNHAEYLATFSEVYPTNPTLMMQIMQSLFPRFGWVSNAYTHNHDSNVELQRKQRIASKERIARYYSLALENGEISKQQILNSARQYTAEQIKEYFTRLESEDSLCTYLHELLAYIPGLSLERRALLFNELIDLETKEEHHSRTDYLSPSIAQKSHRCVYEILRTNTQAENAAIINVQIDGINIGTLPVICEIIVDIEEAYGRIGSSMDIDLQFVSEEELGNIEKSLLNKMRTMSELMCLLDCRTTEDIERLWSYIDKQSWDEFVARTLIVAQNLPKYLITHARIWSSGKSMGWDFDRDHLQKYVDVDDTYQRILSLKNNAEFSALQHRFKQIAIAFCVWYEQEVKDRHQITAEQIDKIIPEWEYIDV